MQCIEVKVCAHNGISYLVCSTCGVLYVFASNIWTSLLFSFYALCVESCEAFLCFYKYMNEYICFAFYYCLVSILRSFECTIVLGIKSCIGIVRPRLNDIFLGLNRSFWLNETEWARKTVWFAPSTSVKDRYSFKCDSSTFAFILHIIAMLIIFQMWHH